MIVKKNLVFVSTVAQPADHSLVRLHSTNLHVLCTPSEALYVATAGGGHLGGIWRPDI